MVSRSARRWTISSMEIAGETTTSFAGVSRVLSGFSRFARIRARASRRWDTRGCEFTEPLKNRGRAYFFADHRDLTGCRYYVVGHCCRPPGPGSRAPGPGPRSSVYPRSLSRVERSRPLLSSTPLHSTPLPSLLSRCTSRVRSPADLRSYIYCIEETRAAAFLAHAPPVMSGLQSPVCLSVRLSRGPVDRSPSMPPTRPFSRERSLFVPLFLLSATVVASARYSSLAWLPRYSISSLSTGTFVHIQIHADQVAPSSRNSFRPGMTDLSPSFLIRPIEVALTRI